MTAKKSILLCIICVVIMVALWALTTLGMMGDTPVGQTGSFNQPLIVPQPYAFAIWSVIYTGLIVLPIYQWIRRQSGHMFWNQFRTLFSINVVLNGLWLVCASFNWLILTLIIIIAMLWTLYQMNELLNKMEAAGVGVNYWTERLVISIYFAWITLATALNMSAALQYYNWSGWGLSQETWSMLILPIVGLIAGAVAIKYRNIAYCGVIIWAFVALVVKHIDSMPFLAYISIGITTIFIGLVIYFIITNRQSQTAAI